MHHNSFVTKQKCKSDLPCIAMAHSKPVMYFTEDHQMSLGSLSWSFLKLVQFLFESLQISMCSAAILLSYKSDACCHMMSHNSCCVCVFVVRWSMPLLCLCCPHVHCSCPQSYICQANLRSNQVPLAPRESCNHH